jgi:hypothetical protein
MPATVTLSTTTLTNGIGPSDQEFRLDSYTGIVPGYRLYIDRELCTVNSIRSDGNGVDVSRGVDGTCACPHASSSVVTIGRADQFYQSDPQGAPAEAIEVSPYINTRNGKIYYAQGDPEPTGFTYRWWQDVTNTYGIGALGIRTREANPTSST